MEIVQFDYINKRFELIDLLATSPIDEKNHWINMLNYYQRNKDRFAIWCGITDEKVCVVAIYEFNQEWISLEHFYRLPDSNYKGCGKYIFEYSTSQISENNINEIKLQCKNNPDLIQYYQSLGFIVDDVQPLSGATKMRKKI